ncbi:MAG: phenylalanine--tRNA ligase subunit beta [Candidatus Nanoarchaeia archaeon]
MVYVYSKLSTLNKYSSKTLSIDEISQALIDMGMDLKGVSEDNDPELKIEITAERVDLISSVGIANAINAYLELSSPQIEIPITQGKESVIVEESVKSVRPKTCAMIVRNLDLSEELLDEIIEIQEKIHESFGRHRKKGAIGIYPMQNISFPIYYRALKPEDIKFRPLESDVEMRGVDILTSHPTGKKYAHLLKGHKKYPTFIDSSDNILSLPPLINSHTTGRVELHHKDVFVEVSGHNEVHLNAILLTLAQVFRSFGAEIESLDVKYVDDDYTYRVDSTPSTKIISIEYVNSLIGLKLSGDEIVQLSNKMMYQARQVDKHSIEFTIPAYKFDVWSACDIVDDIARAYGYNNIESVSPQIPTNAEQIGFSITRNSIRNSCAQLGLIELYTYMLTSTQNQFEKMNKDIVSQKFVKIKDAAEDGINMMRTSVISELLYSLHLNRRVKYPQKVFEVGMTIQEDETCDTKARNEWHLASCLAGPEITYTQIKEVCDSLFKLLGVFDNIEYIEAKDESFIEGRCAQILYNSEKLGVIGELHPQVLDNFGMIVPVSAFEINLEVFREL